MLPMSSPTEGASDAFAFRLSMSPRIAARASLAVFGGWILFNAILVATGKVADPWHQPGVYSIGGAVFAILSLGLGGYARVAGAKAEPEDRSRSLALFPVIGGISYLAYFGLALAGWL